MARLLKHNSKLLSLQITIPLNRYLICYINMKVIIQIIACLVCETAATYNNFITSHNVVCHQSYYFILSLTQHLLFMLLVYCTLVTCTVAEV